MHDTSMETATYAMFREDLLSELKTNPYCCEIASPNTESKTATLCLSCKNDTTPNIYICGRMVNSALEPLIGFWSIALTEDVMKKHVRPLSMLSLANNVFIYVT